MEPFTIIAASLSALGAVSRFFRRKSEQRRNEAARIAAEAGRRVHAQMTATAEAAHNLGRQRSAALMWLHPRLETALAHFNMPMHGDHFDPQAAAKKFAALRSKVLASFVRFEFRGDTAVLAMSTTALVLKGIEYLDQADVISVPVLHQTVGEVIASIPIEGADVLAAHAPLAGLSVADFVADGLVGLSAAMLLRNAYRACVSSDDADALNREASRLDEEFRKLLVYEGNVNAAERDQSEAGYQAYRAAVFAETMVANGPNAGGAWREKVIANLRQAATTWWRALQIEPKMV